MKNTAGTEAVAGGLSLVWVFPDSLVERLDSATWIETARELQNLGWRVELLSKGSAPGRQTIRGVETLSLANRNIYLLGQLIYHLNVIRYVLGRWRKTDIVLFHQESGFWLFALRFVRLLTLGRGPRLVMDTRDLLDPVAGSLRVRVRKHFHALVFWLADFLTDGQTAITPRMAELVGIPASRLWGVWPSGVDPALFLPYARQRSWPAEGEAVRVVYIGVLLEKRHLDLLCRAVIDANQDGAHILLTLVGDGSLRPRLEEYANASKGRIRLQEPVAHAAIPELLSQHHLGVTSLPDPDDVKYQASSPIKLFEYMASGMPILATTNVCHTDVVGDGQYAFWVNSATVDPLRMAMLEIATRREDLPQLGDLALTASQYWTWKAAARKLSAALSTGIGCSA